MSIQPTPGQRTQVTARILMLTGLLCAVVALMRDWLAPGVLATALFGGGGMLLAFAKRAD
jgi:type IV secretory pathway TrbD component